MRSWLWATLLILVLGTPALGQESSSEVKLRRWHLGFQAVNTWRDDFKVFDRDNLPSSAVEKRGTGIGFIFGYRFGDRFLLEIQGILAGHDIPGEVETVIDMEGLITGTVLFRETSFLQPFLRGGFGIGGEVFSNSRISDFLVSFGESAMAGAGIQLRLGSRMSLELEGAATFTNYMATMSGSENGQYPHEGWKVRKSNWGWRVGMGVILWL